MEKKNHTISDQWEFILVVRPRAGGGEVAGGGGQEAGEFGPFLCLASIRAPLLRRAPSSAFPQPACHQSTALQLWSSALLP